MREFEEAAKSIIRVQDRKEIYWEEKAEESAKEKVFPILLNHEKIFLFTAALCSLVFFVYIQIGMSIRTSWFLYLSIAIILTVIGGILDNLVRRLILIYKDTLAAKTNKNHLVKMLKLSKYDDSSVNYILAVVYAAFFVMISITYLGKIKYSGLLAISGEILVDINSLLNIDMDIFLYVITPLSLFTICFALIPAAFFARQRLPKNISAAVFYPIRAVAGLFLILHKMCKSILKIFFLIILAGPEFLMSCFYLMVSVLMALGRKHYIYGIDVDYLLYVKTALIILGNAGYFYCFAKAYA